jgi:hypothetical protein
MNWLEASRVGFLKVYLNIKQIKSRICTRLGKIGLLIIICANKELAKEISKKQDTKNIFLPLLEQLLIFLKIILLIQVRN